jgi:hypothetical protein
MFGIALILHHSDTPLHVRNLFGMVLRLNKLAESIVSLNTRLLRPNTNICPFLQCILCSWRVFNNAEVHPFPLPQIFMPKLVHLRLLVT